MTMTLQTFLIIMFSCAVTMAICRIAPMLVLKGRQLPDRLQQALGFIPPATFAALVANDLVNPTTIAAGFSLTWFAPLLAAGIVAIVALRTRSMAWCIVAGVGSLAVFLYVPGMLL